MALTAGRTGRAGADSGRGNHAATPVARECLPKPKFGPDEHSSWEHLQLSSDRILVRRLEERAALTLTDQPKSIKGVVLAVGPGKWIPGTWWKVGISADMPDIANFYWSKEDGAWEWIPGYYQTPEVKPGMCVLFNSKWNDFSAGENVGSGADGKGPLERPLSYKLDKTLHLVTEGDIFAIVPHLDFKASLGTPTLEKEHFINRRIAGPWSEA
jgi:hypothetical protein